MKLTDAQMAYMAERFLGYQLPPDFQPDGGISFERERESVNVTNTPTGTNLLTYGQALEMVKHMVKGLTNYSNPIPGDEGLTVAEPVYKAVEKILDEESAWISRPSDEVTRRIALAATVAAHHILEQLAEKPSPTPSQPSPCTCKGLPAEPWRELNQTCPTHGKPSPSPPTASNSTAHI